MKTNRVIIAGSRKCPSSCSKLLTKLKFLTQNIIHDMEVVSGGARGADKLGELFAEQNNIPVNLFKPRWNDLGRSAGIKRNIAMAEYATHLIALWDGKSKGTEHMISEARRKGLKIKIVYYAK